MPRLKRACSSSCDQPCSVAKRIQSKPDQDLEIKRLLIWESYKDMPSLVDQGESSWRYILASGAQGMGCRGLGLSCQGLLARDMLEDVFSEKTIQTLDLTDQKMK